MILRDGIVLLEFADLVNEKALSIHAYKKAIHDERIKVVQKGGGGHPALIDYVSLPDRYKELVKAHLGGDPVELASSMAVKRYLFLPVEDERFIDEFKATNGLMLSTKKREALKEAAKVMALLAQLDERHRELGTEQAPLSYGFTSVLKMKEVVLQYIRVAGIDLPGSFPRLETKKRAYIQARKDGLPGLGSGPRRPRQREQRPNGRPSAACRP